MIAEIVQARGGTSVHLTPGEFNALWHVTQALGRFFWHMSPTAQVVTLGVPSAAGMVWLARWDPLAPGKPAKKSKRGDRSRRR